MYEDVKISERHKKGVRTVVEAAINDYNKSINEANTTPKYKLNSFDSEASSVLESTYTRQAVASRYNTFAQTVRTSLLTEALYKLFGESMTEEIKEDPVNRNIMRSIVSSYVNENGYYNIMNRMKTASTAMSSMYKTINESAEAILEDVVKDNPDTFTIDMDDKDEFFQQLDYNDTASIGDAIKDRVSDSIEDFVTANTKDHEDITQALKQAQEKIDNIPPESENLKEYYQMKTKRQINEINNGSKGVFHSMVAAMSEGVMKHKESHAEFINEGHLNMDKIVDRVRIMYTFMEMLNTARIDNINEAYIEEVIEGLKN